MSTGHSLFNPRRRAAAAALTFSLGLALSACASSGDTPGEPLSSAGSIEQVLASAVADGADEAQLDILAAGDVSFESYQEAVNRTIACTRAAGIGVIGLAVTERRGFPEIEFSMGNPSGTMDAYDACHEVHSMWVEIQYVTSPRALEAMGAHFAPYRDEIISCIREHGGQVEDGASRIDVLTSAFDLSIESGVFCQDEAGYAG